MWSSPRRAAQAGRCGPASRTWRGSRVRPGGAGRSRTPWSRHGRTLEGPGEAGGGILAAGEQHQGAAGLSWETRKKCCKHRRCRRRASRPLQRVGRGRALPQNGPHARGGRGEGDTMILQLEGAGRARRPRPRWRRAAAASSRPPRHLADVRLQCGVNGCVPSDMLSTAASPRMYRRRQTARAPRRRPASTPTARSPDYVELEGDTLCRATAARRRACCSRAGGLGLFENLLRSASPTWPTTRRNRPRHEYQSQLRRAGGTVVSNPLPPPFTIAAPGSDQPVRNRIGRRCPSGDLAAGHRQLRHTFVCPIQRQPDQRPPFPTAVVLAGGRHRRVVPVQHPAFLPALPVRPGPSAARARGALDVMLHGSTRAPARWPPTSTRSRSCRRRRSVRFLLR